MSDLPATNRVTRFCKTRKGEIYAGTNGGLFLLDVKANKFAPVELNVQNAAGKPLSVVGLAEDGDGSLWIGHQFVLSRRLPGGVVINYEVLPQPNVTDPVRWLAVDARNRVCLLTEIGRKVIVINPEPANSVDNNADNSKKKIVFREENNHAADLPSGFAYLFKPEEVLAEGTFHSINTTRDGKVWLSGFGKGLVEFDGREFRLYTKENGLSDNTVRTVAEDNFGNLWIASDWGAMKFNRSNFITYHVEDGLGNEQISSIQDRNNVLYVSTANWSISRYDGKKFHTVKLNLPRVGNWNLDRALSDHAGEWWFATGEGLYRFAAVNQIKDLVDAQPEKIYTTEQGLPSNKLRVVFEDSKRDVWMSFDDKPGLLTRWRRESGEFQTFGKEDGIPENCVPQSFREDAAGNLYSPCFSEAFLVRHDDRFTVFRHETFIKEYWISYILVDRKNRIWVATPTKGLLKIENLISGNPMTKVYSTADGLSSESGQFLTEDNDGKIYYLNARALDVLEPETEKVRHYTIADGLSGTGNGVALRDRSGTLWFGAHRGISRYTPQSNSSQAAPPIYIGGLHAGGKNVPVNAVGETKISGITLNSDERQIQIDFFGLALATGESLRYQYKLEGADDDWSRPNGQLPEHSSRKLPFSGSRR